MTSTRDTTVIYTLSIYIVDVYGEYLSLPGIKITRR